MQKCMLLLLLRATTHNSNQVLSRGIKPIRSVPARLCGWNLLFNHTGGFANIESLACIREQNIDLSHLPQPLPAATFGVMLLVCCNCKPAIHTFVFDCIVLLLFSVFSHLTSSPRAQLSRSDFAELARHSQFIR